MSQAAQALEALVQEIIAAKACASPRERAAYNRGFAKLMKLLGPRIRHFTRQYGLTGFWEDAEQVAAIAIHRAIESYDPAKAQFTTFVNWQIRGEMQGLRFRLMTDQRAPARKAGATTISLDALGRNQDGEVTGFETLIEDEAALERVEAGAADYLANAAMEKLTTQYIRACRQEGIAKLHRQSKASAPLAGVARLKVNTIAPADLAKLEQDMAINRDIVEERLFDNHSIHEMEWKHGDGHDLSGEQLRKVSRRAAKIMAEIVAADEHFALMRNDPHVA